MSQKLKPDRNIGNTLRIIRNQKGLTQTQVVAYLQTQGMDISRSIYSQIECGTYNIRVTELDALVSLFEVDYNTVFSIHANS